MTDPIYNFTVVESYDARKEDTRSGSYTERTFTIQPADPVQNNGAGLIEHARRALRNYLVINNMTRDSYGNTVGQLTVSEVDGALGKLFQGVVRWSTPETESTSNPDNILQKNAVYWAQSFSTAGGTATRKYSYKTARYNCNGFIAPDFAGLIGFNGETFDGCQVVSPALSMTIQTRVPYEILDVAAIKRLAAMTGSVNDNTWQGFEAGDALLYGVSANTVTEYPEDTAGGEVIDPLVFWDLRFDFRFSAGGFTNVGGTPIWKNGWDYLWTTEAYNAAESNVKVVAGAYVEQVYPYADFRLLGLG